MRMPRLTEEEIVGRLALAPGWARADAEITRTYQFAGFREAVAFVGRVAEAAEEADHHPDIDVRYREVTLRLTTHDVHGLTAKDFDLAAVCDRLAGGGVR